MIFSYDLWLPDILTTCKDRNSSRCQKLKYEWIEKEEDIFYHVAGCHVILDKISEKVLYTDYVTANFQKCMFAGNSSCLMKFAWSKKYVYLA